MRPLNLSSLRLDGLPAGGLLDPFAVIIARAAAWYDAKTMVDGDDQTIVNSANAAADDATRGLTTGVESQDPTFNVAAGPVRPDWEFDGSDDLIQFPASDTPTFTALTGKHSFVLCAEYTDTTEASARLFSTEGSVGSGLWFRWTGLATGIIDGRLQGSGPDASRYTTTRVNEGDVFVYGYVVDNGSAYVYLNGDGLSAATDITGVGTIAFNAPRLGGSAFNAGNNNKGKNYSFLSLPGEALTEEELDDLSATLISGDYTP